MYVFISLLQSEHVFNKRKWHCPVTLVLILGLPIFLSFFFFMKFSYAPPSVARNKMKSQLSDYFKWFCALKTE